MVGRSPSSSWMHQHATLQTLSSSTLASPAILSSSSPTTSPACSLTAACTGKYTAELDPVSEEPLFRRPEMSSNRSRPKLYTSALAVIGAPASHSGVGCVRDAFEVARPHLRHVFEDLAVPHAGRPVLVRAAGEQIKLGLPARVDLHGEGAGRRVVRVGPRREEAVHAAGPVVAEPGTGEPRVRGVVEALPRHEGRRRVAPHHEVAVILERGDGGARRRGGRVGRPQQGVRWRRVEEELAAVAQSEARGRRVKDRAVPVRHPHDRLLGDLLEPDADVMLLGVARREEAELEVAALGYQRLVPWERLAQGESVSRCSTYLEVQAGEGEQENEDEQHGGL
uniref:Uncharacterized protein n=1 Tax=Zea mays TaxID=4577 RepID=B8A2L7_MAIZE|nr:unknown [Zea mays]